ncbi:MAG: hypothetical protein IPK69_04655 [Phycisphaerales bacterium]|nr:MAG: hypothetical protein IPK69_04655 [Phycisphaerales bacterium]
MKRANFVFAIVIGLVLCLSFVSKGASESNSSEVRDEPGLNAAPWTHAPVQSAYLKLVDLDHEPTPWTSGELWTRVQIANAMREDLAAYAMSQPLCASGLDRFLDELAESVVYQTRIHRIDWDAAPEFKGVRLSKTADSITLSFIESMISGANRLERRAPHVYIDTEKTASMGDLTRSSLLRLAIVLSAESTSNLARMDDRRGGKGAVTRKKDESDEERTSRYIQEDLERVKKLAPVIVDAIDSAVHDPRFQGERIRVVASLIADYLDDDLDAVCYLEAARLYAELDGADPWMAAYFDGVVKLYSAWSARGSADASETLEVEFKAMQMFMDGAYASLRRAHELAPHRPHAATELISLATGSTNNSHETPEFWFQLATRADPLYAAAYSRLASSKLDRWGGSPRDRVSLLRRVEEAVKLDGGERIALVALGLADRASMDAGSISRDTGERRRGSLPKETLTAYTDCLRPLWGHDRPGIDRNTSWTLALAQAWLISEPIARDELLELTDRTYVPLDSDTFNFDINGVRRWVLRFGSDIRQEVTKIDRLEREGKWSEALTATATLHTNSTSHSIRWALEERLTIQEFYIALDAGETIDLLSLRLRPVWEGRCDWIDDPQASTSVLDLSRVIPMVPVGASAFSQLWLTGRVRIDCEVRIKPNPAPTKYSPASSISIGLKPGVNPRAGTPYFSTTIRQDDVRLSPPISTAKRKDNQYTTDSFKIDPVGEPDRHIILDIDQSRAMLIVDGVVCQTTDSLLWSKSTTQIGGLLTLSGSRSGGQIVVKSLRVYRPKDKLPETLVPGSSLDPISPTDPPIAP